MKAIILGVFTLVGLSALAFAQEEPWSIEGKALTADNCVIGCPCIFGEPPTHGRCEYTGIMLIEKGNYGKIKLDNARFALGGAFGRTKELSPQEYDFVAFYIDDAAKADQKEALRIIFASKEFEGFGTPSEVKEAPIRVDGMDNFGKVGKTYGGSVGDFIKIQVTPIDGANKGKPLVVENSAEPLFHWTALGRTSDSYFKGAGNNWTFNGTSGESHRFMVKSGPNTEAQRKNHH